MAGRVLADVPELQAGLGPHADIGNAGRQLCPGVHQSFTVSLCAGYVVVHDVVDPRVLIELNDGLTISTAAPGVIASCAATDPQKLLRS